MLQGSATVRPLLTAGAVGQATGVLCEAFAEYPVMRHVLGPGGEYPARLQALIGFFVTARLLRNDPILGVFAGTELAGVALCTLPGAAEPPPDLASVREETWRTLGDDARARYDAWVRAWEPLAVAQPNLHLNMLGVPRRHRGTGLGRLLLERVHALSRELPESTGVTLTTEAAENVALYRRFGYGLVGHRQVGRGLETWGFYRPD